MGCSHMVGDVAKVASVSKEFRIVQIKEALPIAMQSCCMGILILEPTPFIQLLPRRQLDVFCEQYVQRLQSRGESEAQITRFWRYSRELAQVVYWCEPDTFLVPDVLCRPIGGVITAAWTREHGLRLMAGVIKEPGAL